MSDPASAHYEVYPYPERDPAAERRRLVTGSPSSLAEINHYLFAGRRDFAGPFRALVAGGGTGDAAVMLAQQLADAGGAGTVVYLDPSHRSREIAEARAAARGLRTIRFETGTIAELPGLGLAPFDYIDCCGVLHHLEDPAAALATLCGVLAEGGGIGLMVYGRLGRTGVYEAQDMLRRITPGLEPAERVALARRLLEALPESNWLKRNPGIADHLGSDAGLYDLLLHGRDRAFDVAEVLALLDSTGLRPVTFIEPIRYEPATYLSDPVLLERAAALPWTERAALAERLAGNLRKHVVYAVPKAATDLVARPTDLGAVPLLVGLDPAAGAKAIAAAGALTVTKDGLKRTFPVPHQTAEIVARMDGRRTVGEILRDVAGEGQDRAGFDEAFTAAYRVLNGLNLLLLRAQPASSRK